MENQRTMGTIVFLVNYDRLASPGSRKCEGGEEWRKSEGKTRRGGTGETGIKIESSV